MFSARWQGCLGEDWMGVSKGKRRVNGCRQGRGGNILTEGEGVSKGKKRGYFDGGRRGVKRERKGVS